MHMVHARHAGIISPTPTYHPGQSAFCEKIKPGGNDLPRIEISYITVGRGPALLGATDAAVSRGAGSDPLVIGYKNKTNPSTHTTLVSHEYTESTLSIKCTSDET